MAELTVGLSQYFSFYNSERPHQGLSNKKPDNVYATHQGGGASIPDYFSDARVECPVSLRSTGHSTPEQPGQRCSAAIEAMDIA
jgi:putative transposase